MNANLMPDEPDRLKTWSEERRARTALVAEARALLDVQDVYHIQWYKDQVGHLRSVLRRLVESEGR